MKHHLTAKQRAHVIRVTTDRVGQRDGTAPYPLVEWQRAVAFTAWELYKV